MQLKSAASHLRRAENRLKATDANWSRQSAMQICEAAQLMEGLISQEIGQSAASQSRISDLLNYKAHRGALLLIGWVLANEALCLADNVSRVFAWDEAFNLIERSSASKGMAEPETPVTVADAELEVEPPQFQEAIERRIEAVNAGQEPEIAKVVQEPGMIEVVTADDGRIATEQATPEGLWLIPVKASLAQSHGSSQMLMAPVEYTARNFALERIEIVDPAAEVQTEMVENTAESIGIIDLENKNDAQGFNKAEIQGGETATEAAIEDAKEAAKGAANDPIGNARKELKALKDWLFGLIGGIFTSEKATKVIKALMVVIVVLLAIKVILYLI